MAAPNIDHMKSFIVDNGGFLDRESKLTILRIISMANVSKKAILEKKTNREVSINFEEVGDETLIRSIYGLVKSRIDFLSDPSKHVSVISKLKK